MPAFALQGPPWPPLPYTDPAMPATPNSTDPIQEIERQLGQLRRRDDRLAESLRDTRDERRQIAAQIRTLEANLHLVREATSRRAPARAAALQAGTIADAAASLLRERGAPARLTDLVTELQAAGKLLRSEGAYATLFRALARDARFERVAGARGTWRLRQS